MVDDEDNEMVMAIPSDTEIKKVVFTLNRDSSRGPDGLLGRFYQTRCDIIGDDIIRLVTDIFEGNTLPKSITHSNLVLIL